MATRPTRHGAAVLALLMATACGPASVGATSTHLDPLDAADDPYPNVRGDRCNLATMDSGERFIRLVAFQDAGVVRVDGEPVRLRFAGASLRSGGRFAGHGVTVEIGGIAPAMANSPPRVGIPVVVAVQEGDAIETFEGLWTCGVSHPAPAAPR